MQGNTVRVPRETKEHLMQATPKAAVTRVFGTPGPSTGEQVSYNARMDASKGWLQVSVEDYLEGKKDAAAKHEYVHGEVFALAGSSVPGWSSRGGRSHLELSDGGRTRDAVFPSRHTGGRLAAGGSDRSG